MSDVQIRKFSSTLTALANEKQKQVQKTKKKGVGKPVLVGGGGKVSTKGVDMDYQAALYEDEYDDFM